MGITATSCDTVHTNEGVKVKDEYAEKQYFIMSDSFKNRYLEEEPERYSDECAIYNGLEDSYKVIYKKTADGNYEAGFHVIKNIINSWEYLMGNQTCAGNTITIYDLHY